MALDFPTSPVDGQTYNGFRWDATPGVWRPVAVDPSLSSLTDTDITSPAAGQKLIYDGTNWVNLTGYVYVDTLYFTSNGTFTKASYPWLRAIRVKAIGAGGGGGGAVATGFGTISGGSGGGGGGYAEAFVTNIAALSASVTVTVGAGGAGGAGSAAGSSGGSSSFGTIAGNGGEGGQSMNIPFVPLGHFSVGGNGGGASNADFQVIGSGGSRFISTAVDRISGGVGGEAAVLGTRRRVNIYSTSGNGEVGLGFGGGGSGAHNTQNDATVRTGGSGTNGVVILELYA